MDIPVTGWYLAAGFSISLRFGRNDEVSVYMKEKTDFFASLRF